MRSGWRRGWPNFFVRNRPSCINAGFGAQWTAETILRNYRKGGTKTRIFRQGGRIETANPTASAPGGVYLCQVGEGISCAACCGLYNVADPSRPALEALLARRSEAFAAVPREIEAIDHFGRLESQRTEAGGLPLAAFHHCPFIGFIGSGRDRPGCLLHPLGSGNNGVDYRGLSHYGAMTCNMYFCPTHHRIPGNIKAAFRDAADDWYGFGLTAPDADLMEALFFGQYRHGAETPPPRLRTGNRDPWRRLLSLKADWPYARPGRPLASYFFNDGLHPKPAVDYSLTGKNGSRYDAVFRELHSAFSSASQLAAAEAIIGDLRDKLVEG